jgi:fatty-acid peroxygenase
MAARAGLPITAHDVRGSSSTVEREPVKASSLRQAAPGGSDDPIAGRAPHGVVTVRTPARDRALDSTLSFLRDPYGFISQRSRALGCDLFEARIFLRRTLCMTGRDAARLFYDPRCFERRDATPRYVQETLFGRGGVQGLDAIRHARRKQLFIDLLAPARVDALARIVSLCLEMHARRWITERNIRLYDELKEILTRSVCAWAGLALQEQDVPARTRSLSSLFEGAGAVGPKHWHARRQRRNEEARLVQLIDAVRSGAVEVPDESAVACICRHREEGGWVLERHTAAVELLNVLRPTVAVAVYMLLVAVALEQHGEQRRRNPFGDAEAECFVQEVRRFYPFFPAVAARVRRSFSWRGCGFEQGQRVLLDLYGIDHDPRLWACPDEFRPERFRNRSDDPFDLVPQGGGSVAGGHRCPGEATALALMKVMLRFLTVTIDYDVQTRDLTLDRRRLPALPRSAFVLNNVRFRV